MTGGIAAAEARDRITVAIVDDHMLFRAGLRRLLCENERIQVVAEAADGASAVELCLHHRPQVVLMDVRMPGMDGVEATRRIVELDLGIIVLVLTGSDSEQHVIQTLRAGARGYMLKDTPPESVVRAVIAAAEGEVVLAGSAARRVIDGAFGRHQEPLDGLTPREFEIFALMAEGVPNKKIAQQLGINEKTVRNHVSHVYDKLGVDGRSTALLYGLDKGLGNRFERHLDVLPAERVRA